MTAATKFPTRLTILLIEDDFDIRETIALMLEDEGYMVAQAANGREALDYLACHARPDLILLDLMMPVMDGRQFRRAQLADPALATIPVVVCSALAPDAGLLLPSSRFLRKPVDAGQLCALVRRVCSEA